MESRHRGQGTDTDLMDGEAEGDTVVIAGQPEVLSTQAMQVGSPVVRCMRVRTLDILSLNGLTQTRDGIQAHLTQCFALCGR